MKKDDKNQSMEWGAPIVFTQTHACLINNPLVIEHSYEKWPVHRWFILIYDDLPIHTWWLSILCMEEILHQLRDGLTDLYNWLQPRQRGGQLLFNDNSLNQLGFPDLVRTPR